MLTGNIYESKEEHLVKNGLYKTLYLFMFNRVTDALTALEAQNYGLAADILRKAQQDAEEQFLDAEDEE